MRAFDEPGPPRVIFGAGAEGRVARLLLDAGAQRVLLVATAEHCAGAHRLSVALGPRSVGIWAEAKPQVPRAVADSLLARVAETGADWVVAHGGGTAIGAAKVAGVEAGVRVAAVPTTYSGSEMTAIWATTQDGVKTTARDDAARPSLVVYDPELLVLRPEVAHQSLFNAMAHAVDALFDADAADVHDDAEEAIRQLRLGLDGDGEAALYGAHLAGRALDRAQMALQHKLAHVLGGSFGTPHAPTHAVLLPHTMAFNARGEARRRLVRAFGDDDPAAALWDLAKGLRVPTRLAPMGFRHEHVERAVELSLRKEYPNPRPLDAAGLTRVLSDAVHGRRPSRRTEQVALGGVQGVHAGLPATVRPGRPAKRPRAVVLAVHGRGSSADAFVARIAGDVPRDVAIVAPQADGNTWYPRGFKQVDDNRASLESALTALDAAFAWATALVPPERVALVGSSQGACLALTWLAHRGSASKPGTVAAWTGATIPTFTYDDLTGVHAYLGSASDDPWVAVADVRASAEALREAGAAVTLTVASSDVHAI